MDSSLEGFKLSRISGTEDKEVQNLTIPNRWIFRRFPYPDGELSANSNAPSQSPKLYEKL